LLDVSRCPSAFGALVGVVVEIVRSALLVRPFIGTYVNSQSMV
jgi:hypothetical protein